MYVPPVPPSGVQQSKAPFEAWLDVATARTRSTTAGYSQEGNKVTVTSLEQVVDGSYLMEVDHSDKTVRFSRLSPFQQRVRLCQNFDALMTQMLGDPEQLGAFARVGQEEIDGVAHDIWQGELVVLPGQRLRMRMRYSLSPVSGTIGRIQAWLNATGDTDAWLPAMELTTVQRDAALPPNVFSTDPPQGYTLKNTKDTAAASPINLGSYFLGDISLTMHISFVLDDGSVIVAWGSKDKSAPGAEAGAFDVLVPGGPLPRLPMEVVSLESIATPADVTYVGRHLAVTKKAGDFCEWGIYVPDKELPAGAGKFGYHVKYQVNPPERRVSGTVSCNLGPCLKIGRCEFDALVRGAMAEFSDGGAVPEHVTHEKVMDLSRQIRESLQKELPADRGE